MHDATDDVMVGRVATSEQLTERSRTFSWQDPLRDGRAGPLALGTRVHGRDRRRHRCRRRRSPSCWGSRWSRSSTDGRCSRSSPPSGCTTRSARSTAGWRRRCWTPAWAAPCTPRSPAGVGLHHDRPAGPLHPRDDARARGRVLAEGTVVHCGRAHRHRRGAAVRRRRTGADRPREHRVRNPSLDEALHGGRTGGHGSLLGARLRQRRDADGARPTAGATWRGRARRSCSRASATLPARGAADRVALARGGRGVL